LGLVQHVERHAFRRERRPRDRDELALEELAGREEEEQQEDEQHALAEEPERAHRPGPYVAAHVERLLLDLHPRDAARGVVVAGRLRGAALDLARRLLHALQRVAVAATR